METYLDRIKRLKAEQKLTNDQLAEKSGIPLGTLSKILAGMNDSPKLCNIMAICNALGCTVEYIADGTPENTNNYTLSTQEIAFIEDYRRLDMFGKSMIETILKKELERLGQAPTQMAVEAPSEPKSAKILDGSILRNRYVGEKKPMTGKRDIAIYDLPVSAGVGVYLDEPSRETIAIPNNERTAAADYALRVSGNSMEPKYMDGDILLVQTTDAVEAGELGVFLLDGCGFFKVYQGDHLKSLNPEYGPIMLKDFTNVQCRGRVVGRMKRKQS
jgi:repressor LexA